MVRISMRNVQKSTVEEYFSLYLSSAVAKGVKFGSRSFLLCRRNILDIRIDGSGIYILACRIAHIAMGVYFVFVTFVYVKARSAYRAAGFDIFM